MLKKITCFGIALILLFSFASCIKLPSGQNSELAEYKTTKKTELQEYANAKGKSNYSESGWIAICKAVTDGKEVIDAAKNKPAVDTAFNGAKDAIDEVEKEVDKVENIEFTLVLGRMDYGWATYIETIVGSLSEWLALNTIADLPELQGKFDEQFFENSALIVFALGRMHKGAQFEKAEVFGQNKELLVKVYDDRCASPAEQFSTWIVVIEVQKNLIKDFTELRLETNFVSFNGSETDFYSNNSK